MHMYMRVVIAHRGPKRALHLHLLAAQLPGGIRRRVGGLFVLCRREGLEESQHCFKALRCSGALCTLVSVRTHKRLLLQLPARSIHKHMLLLTCKQHPHTHLNLEALCDLTIGELAHHLRAPSRRHQGAWRKEALAISREHRHLWISDFRRASSACLSS